MGILQDGALQHYCPYNNNYLDEIISHRTIVETEKIEYQLYLQTLPH